MKQPNWLSEADAIAEQRRAGRERNFNYASDADALTDFLVIHWAWIEENGQRVWPEPER